MDIDIEIYINQLAQGIWPMKEGVEWFSRHSSSTQLAILGSVYYFIMQSGVAPADVAPAIENSGLRRTSTPCVLIGKGRLSEQVAKILNLPKDEYRSSFLLLIALLTISDGRRRARCGIECSHWWHRDLSSEEEVQRIKRGIA